MKKLNGLILVLFCMLGSLANAADLPRVTGLALTGDQLSWDAQEGATGYNIHLNYQYFDTVRGPLSYTLTEPGRYHVISFNDAGDFGVTRNEDEGGTPYISVEFAGGGDTVDYDFQGSTLFVYNTCKDVGPGESCIARCPREFRNNFVRYLSGGACSTSDIVEADAFVSPLNYKCTVPTFSGEVVAQAICIID